MMQHFLSNNGTNICPVTSITFVSNSRGGEIRTSSPSPELGDYDILTLNMRIKLTRIKSDDSLFYSDLIKA